MSDNIKQRLFRDSSGEGIKEMLDTFEGISFKESPLDFFILLARYKFPARFIKKHNTIADVGCGPGYGTIFLSQFSTAVTGLDCDAELLKSNGQRYSDMPNVAFEHYDLLKPEAYSKKFDVVISMDVIEHFNQSDQPKVVDSLHSLVNANGFAVIGTPSATSAPYGSPRRRSTHLHEFTPEEFEELLRGRFRQVFLFSMTDEAVSTSFVKLAWYLMAICTV